MDSAERFAYSGAMSLAETLDALRLRVDARLEAFLDERAQRLSALAPDAALMVEAVRSLTLRGGKRLRPALVVEGHRAVAPGVDEARVEAAALSVELLQTYLLIQDDWMDRDEVRRGGPTVHHALRQRFDDPHMADSVALLASDLACAWAHAVLIESGFAPDRIGRALSAFVAMHEEVVVGQLLDVTGRGDVETVHRLKTAAYTVVGPLRLGAWLGGASPAQVAALDAFGWPIGVAFQLRDDVLGTFGDPGSTGKAASTDLRVGKRTALVTAARARLSGAARARLEDVLSGRTHAEADVEAARAAIESCGARAEVEARIGSLRAEAEAALAAAGIDDGARRRLLGYAALLVDRLK